MLLWLGITTLLIYFFIGLIITIGSRKIDYLRDTGTSLQKELPYVSIIIAARNEERNIRTALDSLLKLDYPELELLVVNDRSEDSTAKILDEMSAASPRLTVLHVQELPKGWLGKNHALWFGSKQASGEFLLFTDADVVMAPETLTLATRYMNQHGLDHLAATPEVNMPNNFLNMFGATFGFVFAIFTRPWKAPDPESSCHIGIGAFNLVRAECYRYVGGHRKIAMRPDDDLKLGKIIKNAGFRQKMVYGNDLISVEWYANVREVILGLEKNIFAGADYRLWFVVTGVIFHLVASLWPYFAIFATTGWTQLVYLSCVLLITLIAADSTRFHGLSPWYALGFPLTIGLFTFIVIRTLYSNLSKGGISWRGTFYSLEELKKNRI